MGEAVLAAWQVLQTMVVEGVGAEEVEVSNNKKKTIYRRSQNR